MFSVQINGENSEVNPPNTGSHFEHVNLLGTDFLGTRNAKVFVDYERKTATMYFPTQNEEASSDMD